MSILMRFGRVTSSDYGTNIPLVCVNRMGGQLHSKCLWLLMGFWKKLDTVSLTDARTYCPYDHLGDSSLSSRLQDQAGLFLGNPKTPLDQSIFDDLLSWAKQVKDTAYADMDSIHNYLVDTTTPGKLKVRDLIAAEVSRI